MGRAIDTHQTMFNYVADGLSDFPDSKTVVYFKGNKISKGRLLRDTDKFCAYLCSLGIGKGDVVTIHLPNLPNAACAFYAVNKLGAIANLIHPLMPPLPLGEMTRAAGSKLIVTFDEYYAKNADKLDLNCKAVVCSASDYLPPVLSALYKLK